MEKFVSEDSTQCRQVLCRRQQESKLACLLAVVAVSAEKVLKYTADNKTPSFSDSFFYKIAHFLWQPEQMSYHHVWPRMRFWWKIIIGKMIGFVSMTFGSVGGVGGGGIFVPMLTFIIGFDPKSATAISKWLLIISYLWQLAHLFEILVLATLLGVTQC